MMPKPISHNFFIQTLPRVAVLLLSLFAFSVSRADLDTIIIDQGVDDPIRIAVVPFEVSEDLADKDNPAKLIRFDLARSGQFDPIASEDMLSYPSTENAVFFRDWRILQMAYLVIGQAQSNVFGEIEVSYQLFDVATQTKLQRANFRVTSDQWRDVGHQNRRSRLLGSHRCSRCFQHENFVRVAEDVGTERATYSLQMADVDGERTRTLYRSTAPILSASWSPDGQRVAYVSFETGRPSIIFAGCQWPNREQLTGFRGINGSPVFSPDGKQLAMVLSRSGDPEIFVMNLENRKLRRITRHPAIDTEPSWSPDGKYLIFTSRSWRQAANLPVRAGNQLFGKIDVCWRLQCSSAAVARRQALGVRASPQRRLSYCMAGFIGRSLVGTYRV